MTRFELDIVVVNSLLKIVLTLLVPTLLLSTWQLQDEEIDKVPAAKEAVAWCGTGALRRTNEEKIKKLAPGIAIDASKGKELFDANCTACHAIEKDKVGPALQGIASRREINWITSFVRNPMKKIKMRDKYAVELFYRYNQTEMTAFPAFTDEEILSIIAYVD